MRIEVIIDIDKNNREVYGFMLFFLFKADQTKENVVS
jgi:hypothetical protein